MPFLSDAGHPTVIARLLHDYELTPKKGAGQNFFSDPFLLDKIADAAELTDEDQVLEIGPGLGALTQRLSERAGNVIAVELDTALLPVLAETLEGAQNVRIVNADVMKLSDAALSDLFDQSRPIKVVSNLPYGITTDVMQKLLLSELPIVSVTVLVQKEAAQRICAEPGQKQYGLTAMLREWYTEGKILFDVPPESFFPRPSVMSAVVRLVFRSPRPEPASGADFLWRTAKAVIALRRKTIVNNLSAAGFSKEQALSALEKCGIAPTVRGEVLSVYEIAGLANALKNA